MARRPRLSRRDDNEGAIIDAFESCGCQVWQLGEDGPADLIVDIGASALHHRLRLVEVKDPAKPPSKRRLTPTQKTTHATWPIHVVHDFVDVLAIVSLARGRLRRA